MRDPAELISAYFDESLTEGELATLRAWLMAEPGRLRQFVRESVIHSRLRDVMLQQDMRGLVFDEMFGDAVDPQHVASLLDEEERSAMQRAREAAEQTRRDALAAMRQAELLDRKTLRIDEPRPSRVLTYASLIAAAALLLMLGRLSGPTAKPKTAPPVAVAVRQEPAEPPVIAKVVKAFEATLRRADRTIAAGAKLQAGSLVVERGVAEVKFAAGATMVVEGPAEVDLVTAERATLIKGRVVVRVPHQAIGFTLRSDAATFIDLGTEFAVEIGAAGQSRIHVLEGEVALVSGEKGNAPSRTLQRGVASEVAIDGSVHDIQFDASRFLRHVPASEYELAVLKSRPLAYWRLNQLDADELITSEGRLVVDTFARAGVSTATNKNGDGPAHAAAFSGEHEGIEIAGDAALGLVSNCTCEAWIYSGDVNGPQRIFSTFDRPRSGMAIGIVDTKWYRLPGDELRFHLTLYGQYDCLSATPVRAGQWVHLAATIDAAGTPTLYVNGEKVDRRFRPMGSPAGADAVAGEPAAWLPDGPTPLGITTAGQARIGRNPFGANGQISPERWQGQISNVAVYDRVLSDREIQQHVEATRKP